MLLPTYLQLSKGKAATSAHATVVLDRGAAHNRSQLVDGTRSDLGGFLLAGVAAAMLAAGLRRESGGVSALQAPLLSGREGIYLVEVHADSALPVLAEICVMSATSGIRYGGWW